MIDQIISPKHRHHDPLNYKESCYRLIWILNKEHYPKYESVDDIIGWLGSPIGQNFLKQSNELIDEYPFKDICCGIKICGETQDYMGLFCHHCWFLAKSSKKGYQDDYIFVSNKKVHCKKSDTLICFCDNGIPRISDFKYPSGAQLVWNVMRFVKCGYQNLLELNYD
jgi:hypothetical protein